MRKILVLLLTFTMMLTLFGCGAESQNPLETPEVSGQTDKKPVDATEEVNIDSETKSQNPSVTAEVSKQTDKKPVDATEEVNIDSETKSQKPSKKTEASEQTDKKPADATEEVKIDSSVLLEIAQETYKTLNALATAVDIVGSDICKAWHTAIWDADNVVNGGAAYLSGKLTMSEDELREGIAHMAFSKTGEDWASITDEQWEELRQKDSSFAEAQERGGLFDYCISIVWSGYLEQNLYSTMDETMTQVKGIIRQLKEVDPENEYVKPLKEYYSVIRSYLEWCKAPDGSYNEAEELLNSFENKYRSYRDNLEFDLG